MCQLLVLLSINFEKFSLVFVWFYLILWAFNLAAISLILLFGTKRNSNLNSFVCVSTMEVLVHCFKKSNKNVLQFCSLSNWWPIISINNVRTPIERSRATSKVLPIVFLLKARILKTNKWKPYVVVAIQSISLKSPSHLPKKKKIICFSNSPSKMMKNVFFHLKSSFRSQDI